jgi:hypothetical protein
MQTFELEIEFPDPESVSIIETLPVTHLGDAVYLAEASSVWRELYWHDKFEMELLNERSGRFVRLIERSGMRVSSFLISQALAESRQLQQDLDRVVEVGGFWERVYGGVLLIHLPPDTDSSVESLLQSIIPRADTDSVR